MRFPAVLEVLLNRTSGCSRNIQKGKKCIKIFNYLLIKLLWFNVLKSIDRQIVYYNLEMKLWVLSQHFLILLVEDLKKFKVGI